MKTTSFLITIGTTLILTACSVQTKPTVAALPPLSKTIPKVELPDVPIYTDPTFSSLVKIDKTKPIDVTGDDIVKDKHTKNVTYIVELSTKKWTDIELPSFGGFTENDKREIFIDNIKQEIANEAKRLLKSVGFVNVYIDRAQTYFGGVSGFLIEERADKVSPKLIEKLRALPEITDIYLERKTTLDQVEASAQGTENIKDGEVKGINVYGKEVTDYYVKLVGGTRNGTGKKCFIMDTGLLFLSLDLLTDKEGSISFVTETGEGGVYDINGHGSHVAGIAGAAADSMGIIGVAQNTSLIAVKVLNKNGSGQVSWVVNGLNYLYNVAKKGDVVNMSLALRPNDLIDNAVRRLADRGVIIVVAAGNGGTSTSNFSPQRIVHPNVYVVGGVDLNNKICSFSNYGDNVRYYEPAVSLLSKTCGGYGRKTGTSMAAPVLSGILVMGKGVRVVSESTAFIGGKMRKIVIGGHP